MREKNKNESTKWLQQQPTERRNEMNKNTSEYETIAHINSINNNNKIHQWPTIGSKENKHKIANVNECIEKESNFECWTESRAVAKLHRPTENN